MVYHYVWDIIPDKPQLSFHRLKCFSSDNGWCCLIFQSDGCMELTTQFVSTSVERSIILTTWPGKFTHETISAVRCGFPVDNKSLTSQKMKENYQGQKFLFTQPSTQFCLMWEIFMVSKLISSPHQYVPLIGICKLCIGKFGKQTGRLLRLTLLIGIRKERGNIETSRLSIKR